MLRFTPDFAQILPQILSEGARVPIEQAIKEAQAQHAAADGWLTLSLPCASTLEPRPRSTGMTGPSSSVSPSCEASEPKAATLENPICA